MKLLLKLIKDHKDACDNKEKKNDGRRMLRVATMMTILDTVRSRIQKCQSFGGQRSAVEAVADEKEKLRRELSASMAARKSLEIMCSSLGKEKEIMAAELSKKVHELSEMEELINDLKEQNETLLEKVRECGLKHRDERCDGGLGGGGGEGESQGNAALQLQERNKALSEQLLRSLDGNRSMKMKLRDAEEENVMMQSAMDEMRAEVVTSLERVRSFKERMLVSSTSNIPPPLDVQEEIVALENMFECFQMLVAKYDQKQQGEWVKITSKINARKPSVLA